MNIGELRKAIENVPDDTVVSVGLRAEEGNVLPGWNGYGTDNVVSESFNDGYFHLRGFIGERK